MRFAALLLRTPALTRRAFARPGLSDRVGVPASLSNDLPPCYGRDGDQTMSQTALNPPFVGRRAEAVNVRNLEPDTKEFAIVGEDGTRHRYRLGSILDEGLQGGIGPEVTIAKKLWERATRQKGIQGWITGRVEDGKRIRMIEVRGAG